MDNLVDNLVGGTKCECNIGQRLNRLSKSCEVCPLTDSDGNCVEKCPNGKGSIDGTCMPCPESTPLTYSDGLVCVKHCPPGERQNDKGDACEAFYCTGSSDCNGGTCSKGICACTGNHAGNDCSGNHLKLL